ncbi:hypothetical protein [Sorangium sp. So ce233]|uniref:hypothetical protein n=1 Tax=Sorangium sp. So ce233 TaxID=3133290 RepID=UPI003F5E24E2
MTQSVKKHASLMPVQATPVARQLTVASSSAPRGVEASWASGSRIGDPLFPFAASGVEASWASGSRIGDPLFPFAASGVEAA